MRVMGIAGLRELDRVDLNTVFNTADVTLYAVMKANWTSSTVKFMWNYDGAPDGGVYYSAKTDCQGNIIGKEDPKRDGYTFGGWCSNPECEFEPLENMNSSRYDNDMVWYAKWIKN